MQSIFLKTYKIVPANKTSVKCFLYSHVQGKYIDGTPKISTVETLKHKFKKTKLLPLSTWESSAIVNLYDCSVGNLLPV